MSLKAKLYLDRLKKRAATGKVNYPIATIAYYGPDNKFASKVAVGIIVREGADVATLERWFADRTDVRFDAQVNEAIVQFLTANHVQAVASADRILGCPHEEGVDYPDGEVCPVCAYWAGRDRFA